MNISRENIDEQNAILTVNLTKEEITPEVDKILKDYRKKAQIPGFRPGMVPMGMIKKMYGNAVLVDELNKKVSESLQNYFVEEKLDLLGDPLPSEDQDNIDIENQDVYDFKFDIAISPEFELNLTKRDKIDYYVIDVNKKMVDEYIENLQNRYGNFVEAEKADENSLMKGELIQIDSENNILENGIKKEDASISLKVVKDEKTKKELIKSEIGQIIQFDLKKALPNESELAALLDIDKSKIENLEGNFQITISEIKNFVPAELNEEFFQQSIGDEEVKTEKEFRDKIKAEIQSYLETDSKYKFMLDARSKLINKLKLPMPEAFLKRWVIATNKNLTDDQLENEFPRFLEDLQWMLIKSKLAKDNEIIVAPEEIKEEAKKSVENQFKQYGMSYIPNEYLEKYADEILSKEEERKQIYDKVLDNKIIDYIFETVKLNEIKVSQEEFKKLFE
ncbi:MAG TPA: trigger factor [Bacteroidales bacterium]|nr:trigger factor [Bacteroidales bacterium]